MRQLNKLLYVTDLDGTLLREDTSLSRFTINTLNNLINKGINITYATARSATKSKQLVKTINFQIPAIVLNGAQLIDTVGDDIYIERILEYNLVSNILKMTSVHDISPIILGENNGTEILCYSESNKTFNKKFIELRNGDKRLFYNQKLFIPNKVFIISYLANKELLIEIENEIINKYGELVKTQIGQEIYIHDCYTLEIRNINSNKSIMLNELCKKLNFEINNVCYFGDEVNDLDIFKVVGKKIAVENANSIIIKEADKVIGSNMNDGVAQYLYDISRLK